MTQDQLDDFQWLLSHSVARGNIAWIASTVLGPSAVSEAGNQIGDVEAFAHMIVQALQREGRVADAVALLRQEAHRHSRLTLGLNYIMSGNRLNSAEALQAFVNEYEPFLSAANIQERLPKILRTVCAVALGSVINEIRGSGFLVGPDLVMTNYHVLREFLSVQNGMVKPNGDGKDIFFFFDYLWEPAPSVPPAENVHHSSVSVKAAQEWLVYGREDLPNDGSPDAPAVITRE